MSDYARLNRKSPNVMEQAKDKVNENEMRGRLVNWGEVEDDEMRG